MVRLSNHKQDGFTLIELIMVMSIISVLFIATIRWPGRTINLGAQTQQLVNDIRYTQFLAMSRNERYRISLATNQYTLTQLDGNTPENFPGRATNIVTLEIGTTLTTTSASLIFDGNGIPYDNSVTALTAEETISLTTEGTINTITISPETGKVTI